ncbi:MAG TPA: class I SAM-dependent methyltransferase [Rhizobiaceae bacterium]|nr:class I SAM-dependent methyltransferase [Rhizobiaceae bacterium]
MSNWTDGYVSDIEYLEACYIEQTPAHLNTACLLRGVEPPVAAGQPYRYCELGCGLGKSAATIAAACPDAEVWGFDFNPAHIARGNQLAQLGHLANLHLEDCSFADLAGPKGAALPRFHYIAMHGVWSWISPENRRHIVEFIGEHLEPGGLVYVTYNALPGWNSVAPVQRLLWASANLEKGRSDQRVGTAIRLVRQMSETGAIALPIQQIERLEDECRKDNLSYLAHEYLNDHWQPFYHMDVAAALAPAKLTYAASANILDNYPDICVNKEQRAFIDDTPSALRETVRDYFMTRSFRRDIFIRGSRPVPARRLEQRLRQIRLTAIVPPKSLTRNINVPIGEATLGEDFYAPALEMISRDMPTIEEIFDHAGGGNATAREAVGMLIGSKQAMAVVTPELAESARARVRAYNAAQIRLCADGGKAHTSLAGAAIGSAVLAGLVEMLVYEALADGIPAEAEPVIADCWKRLQRRGDRLADNGKVIESEAENIDLLRRSALDALTLSLPIWRRVGAI